MKIILLTSDLMTSSQVAAAAKEIGAELASAETLAQALNSLQDEGADLVVFDLSAPIPPAELIAQLKTVPAPPKVVAFGPHVHVGKLKAARAAGCDEVLTRGQFFAEMREVLSGAR